MGATIAFVFLVFLVFLGVLIILVILVIMFFRVFLYLHILFLGPPGWLSDVHTTVCVANMGRWAQ